MDFFVSRLAYQVELESGENATKDCNNTSSNWASIMGFIKNLGVKRFCTTNSMPIAGDYQFQ